MSNVVNLNRFRKKKAKEEKAKRAETNKRLHGRTKAERARDEADKKRLESKLNGAFLVREDVRIEDVPAEDALQALDDVARSATSLSEYGKRKSERGAALEPEGDKGGE